MSSKSVTSSSLNEGGKREGVTKDGVSRTMAKLEKRIADGDYYEAHQLYRIIYFR